VCSHIVPHERSMDLAYNALIAIQSSAFLMTLFRKSIIAWYHHAIVYTLAIAISASYIYAQFPHMWFLAGVATVAVLRVGARINKYVLYSGFSIWVYVYRANGGSLDKSLEVMSRVPHYLTNFSF
jgi:hypothetical protein